MYSGKILARFDATCHFITITLRKTINTFEEKDSRKVQEKSA